VESSAASHDDLLASQHLVLPRFPVRDAPQAPTGSPRASSPQCYHCSQWSHGTAALSFVHNAIPLTPLESPAVFALSTERRPIGYFHLLQGPLFDRVLTSGVSPP
jgi:hypothetical protein